MPATDVQRDEIVSQRRESVPEALRNFPSMMKESPALRVLVVDDELLIRWSLTEALASAGHTVVDASDGKTAMTALSEQGPMDVVFLDFRLPDSSDLTLLANIRRMSPGSAVILMTAFGTPEVARGALELGARLVLSKPFDMSEIPAVLASISDAGH